MDARMSWINSLKTDLKKIDGNVLDKMATIGLIRENASVVA